MVVKDLPIYLLPKFSVGDRPLCANKWLRVTDPNQKAEEGLSIVPYHHDNDRS